MLILDIYFLTLDNAIIEDLSGINICKSALSSENKDVSWINFDH